MSEALRLKVKVNELEKVLEQIELLSDWTLWSGRTNKDKNETLEEINNAAKTALIKKTTGEEKNE